MAKNRQEILESVAQGEMSAVEAAQLLADVEKSDDAIPTVVKVVTPETAAKPKAEPQSSKTSDATAPAWLRIHIRNADSGKKRVQVSIPYHLVKIGVKLSQGFLPEMKGINWQDAFDAIENGESGTIIDIEDENEGEHIHIFVE